MRLKYKNLFYCIGIVSTLFVTAGIFSRIGKAGPQLFDTEGAIEIETGNITLSELEDKLKEVKSGGKWRPSGNKKYYRVAIIVPYRDRERELVVFLRHMHPFLQRQQLDYEIYIIEQNAGDPFNRGMLFNIGFLEATNRGSFDCVVFHDVDVLPENDKILYKCADHPRHLSVACSRWGYRLLYEGAFGGVVAMTTEQFQRINGYSNAYFGWGAEDDDLYNRVTNAGYKVLRYPESIARYNTLEHETSSFDTKSAKRYYYLSTWRSRARLDGLNSVSYSVRKFNEHKLFTEVAIRINMEVTMIQVDAISRFPYFDSFWRFLDKIGIYRINR